MPSAQASARSVVPELMNTVKQLSMAELNEFKRGFADWQAENRSQDEELGGLLEACRLSLPTPDENRLKKLIGKSERGMLGQEELEEYRALVRRAERLDVTRLTAITHMARRLGKPVQAVLTLLKLKGGEDKTPSRSLA